MGSHVFYQPPLHLYYGEHPLVTLLPAVPKSKKIKRHSISTFLSPDGKLMFIPSGSCIPASSPDQPTKASGNIYAFQQVET